MTSLSTPAQVDSRQSLEDLIGRVKAAQECYASFSQAQVDTIFKQAAIAANNARIPLAKQAVAETGMGIVEDKVIKNHLPRNISTTNINRKKPVAWCSRMSTMVSKNTLNPSD